MFLAANILLPKKGVDLEKWAVIACDQFTSEPLYWHDAESLVGDAPSTLHMILPEVYLEEENVQSRISDIHSSMLTYHDTILTTSFNGFVYIERETSSGTRQGLVGMVDLEEYAYEKGTHPKIRPSENTVEERIPPRLAVRRGAKLESPHILLLVDDAKKTVIEPLAEKKNTLLPLYDVSLMLGGGSARAWAVTDKKDIDAISNALSALEDENEFYQKYPAAKGKTTPFSLAVGDGNHSLATAKALWEETKSTLSQKELENHPARYCLVELENIQSDAINVEPIHRVVFGVGPDAVKNALSKYAKNHGITVSNIEGGQHFSLVYGENMTEDVYLIDAKEPLVVGSVDAFLELCAAENPEMYVDYVHGDDSVSALVSEQKAVGLLMPPFAKDDIFRGVALGGVLPKKTFSMGHAKDKRYYMECRSIL